MASTFMGTGALAIADFGDAVRLPGGKKDINYDSKLYRRL